MSKAEYSLDIWAEVCPFTNLKTKVLLDNTALWLAWRIVGEMPRKRGKTLRPRPFVLDWSLRPAGLIAARAVAQRPADPGGGSTPGL